MRFISTHWVDTGQHVDQVHPVMSEAERIINPELLTEKLNQLNVFIGIKTLASAVIMIVDNH